MNGLDTAIEKIYSTIAESGFVTDNQLFLIMLYENRNKPKRKDAFEEILGYGKKIVNIINKNLEK